MQTMKIDQMAPDQLLAVIHEALAQACDADAKSQGRRTGLWLRIAQQVANMSQTPARAMDAAHLVRSFHTGEEMEKALGIGRGPMREVVGAVRTLLDETCACLERGEYELLKQLRDGAIKVIEVHAIHAVRIDDMDMQNGIVYGDWLPNGIEKITRRTVDEAPWDDCKVAFGVRDDDAVWDARDSGRLKLPVGWELNGTDAAGARVVAIFRVEGVPTREAGEEVLNALRSCNLLDEPATPSKKKPASRAPGF